MAAKVFFDTNVLVYAAIGAGKDDLKRQRSLTLIKTKNFRHFCTTLAGFFVTVVQKAARPLSPARALEWIEQFTEFRAKLSITV